MDIGGMLGKIVFREPDNQAILLSYYIILYYIILYYIIHCNLIVTREGLRVSARESF